MPYRRRRFKKTYRRGRGRYGRYRRKRTYARGRRAIKVYAMRQSARRYGFRKAIQRVLNVEKKWFKTSNFDSTSTAQEIILSSSLNLVPRGSGPNERIGTQIAINAIKFSAFVRPHFYAIKATDFFDPGHATVNHALDNSQIITVELWVDKQPEAGALTNIDALYEDSSISAADPTAFRNKDRVSRFSKVKTLKWNIQAAGVGVTSDTSSGNVAASTAVVSYTGGGVRKTRIRFKKPLVIKFDPSDDATPTVTEVMNRNLILVYRRSFNVPQIHYVWNVQLDYTDV